MVYLKENNNVIIVVRPKFTKWNHDISPDFLLCETIWDLVFTQYNLSAH